MSLTGARMTFNYLLQEKGIDLKGVLLLRHRPVEPRLRNVLPWLTVDQPKLFNAYQQTQGEKVEKAMQSASHVAAFIGSNPRRATYVGVYRQLGSTTLTADECNARPEMTAL